MNRFNGGALKRPLGNRTLAAIDVGTNAVRLEMARPLPDGTLETLHQERDPVRPGERLFNSGSMPKDVADRLLVTLRRYAALCRRHRARVRAVATSAVREAKNGDDIVRRAREEAGLLLEVISGREEARLMCLGVLAGKPAHARSLCLDVGGGSTELATAVGDRPSDLWSVSLGAVRLAELFDAFGTISPKKLRLLRGYAAEAVGDTLPRRISGFPRRVLGTSGTIRAVVGFAAAEGTAHATPRQLSRAVETLADMDPARRRKRFDARRADIVVTGAVIVEAIAHHMGLESVTAVDQGLRNGVLVDLARRGAANHDHSLADAARALGRRFFFDERHGEQVARLALALFDGLATVHRLPAHVRTFLEVAALLHDVGNALSYQKHHRHTEYLIANADIPGLGDAERDLVARIARYHRRSPPDIEHAGMAGLSMVNARLVRKAATLLRIADSLDRSHGQPVRVVGVRLSNREVTLRMRRRGVVDLELWDLKHEAALFHQVFGRTLHVWVEPK